MPEARSKRLLLAALILILLCLGGFAFVAFKALSPYDAPRAETFVDIDRGMSTRAIAERLSEAGVIRAPWAFVALRLLHPRSRLQAGEYRFGPSQNALQVFDKIRRGEIYFDVVTIPEGSNRFDIAAIVASGTKIKAEDFLKAAADPEIVRDLDPSAPSLEGYLFPSTYQVTRSTTAPQLCLKMTGEFRKQWRKIEPGNASGEAVHRIVTVASLVEKETGLPAERPLVASVFMNRLRLNMPLQCDPTTVYAALIENRYTGVIRKSDLASLNPYNTYAHAGLPPGAIANPGIESLKAAAQPADGTYLYFVARADGSGGHHFSSTLAEHEKAVAQFRHLTHP